MSVEISDAAKSLFALSEELSNNLSKIDSLNKESLKIQQMFFEEMKRISKQHEMLIEQNEAIQFTIRKLNAHI